MRFPAQRLADLRAQRAANRVGAERLTELARAPRPRPAAGRDGGDPRLRRAPHPRRDRRPPRRHPPGRGRARGRRRRPRPRHRAPGRGDDLRRVPDARLRRHRPAGRGQPQLPALGDQVRRLLRGPGADRPRRAAVGRRLPPDRGPGARGLPAERPPPGGGRGRQRRDLEPGRGPRDQRPRRRPRGPRPGTGDDEQPHPRQRRVRLLRDDRRRPGRLPRRRRPERRSTSRCRTR